MFVCNFCAFTLLIDAICACVFSMYWTLTKSQCKGTAKCFVIASSARWLFRDQAGPPRTIARYAAAPTMGA